MGGRTGADCFEAVALEEGHVGVQVVELLGAGGSDEKELPHGHRKPPESAHGRNASTGADNTPRPQTPVRHAPAGLRTSSPPTMRAKVAAFAMRARGQNRARAHQAPRNTPCQACVSASTRFQASIYTALRMQRPLQPADPSPSRPRMPKVKCGNERFRNLRNCLERAFAVERTGGAREAGTPRETRGSAGACNAEPARDGGWRTFGMGRRGRPAVRAPPRPCFPCCIPRVCGFRATGPARWPGRAAAAQQNTGTHRGARRGCSAPIDASVPAARRARHARLPAKRGSLAKAPNKRRRGARDGAVQK
jgi:hypothetical protein